MPKRTKKPEVIIPDPPLPSSLASASPEAIERVEWPCPTCGTAKTANRCDVCGHQEHDT
jgi:recombinational DNA repair protein RecR